VEGGGTTETSKPPSLTCNPCLILCKKNYPFLDKPFHPIPKCTFSHFSQVQSLCSGWFNREMKYLTRASEKLLIRSRGFSWLASIKFQAVALKDVVICSSVLQSYKICNPGVHKFFKNLGDTQNPRSPKGKIKQVSYWEPRSVRCHHKKCCRYCDPAPGICSHLK